MCSPSPSLFFFIYTVFSFKGCCVCVQNLPLHYCLYPDSENRAEAISKKAVKSVIANCFTRLTLFYPNRLAYTQVHTHAQWLLLLTRGDPSGGDVFMCVFVCVIRYISLSVHP